MQATLLMKVLLKLLRGEEEQVLLEAIDYLMAEARILRLKYEKDCGRRLLLNDEQRRQLAVLARPVINNGFDQVIQMFQRRG